MSSAVRPSSSRDHRSLAMLLAALPSIGPFSIDAYLPSLQEICSDFNVTEVVAQQTLTAYMLPFALMTLWHGAISDALGRRRVIIVMMALFTLATIACVFAWNIESLIVFRALEGMTAGAGMVIGRAIVRDLLEGPEAQRLLALVTMTFAFAPAIAPVVGGWLHVWFGWRAVFVFLALLATGITIWTWKALPETLPPEQREPFKPRALLGSYARVLSSLPFLSLGLSLTCAFAGIFLYIVSAPEFLMKQLGVAETGFLWLFGPVTAGMFIGMLMSNRMAGRWSASFTMSVAISIMLVAGTINTVFHYVHPPELPWSVLPLFLYIVGSSLSMPTLTLLALDLFPKRRGTAASCQSFLQSSGNVVVTGFLAPLLWGSTRTLAFGQLTLGIAAALFFGLYWVLSRRQMPPTQAT